MGVIENNIGFIECITIVIIVIISSKYNKVNTFNNRQKKNELKFIEIKQDVERLRSCFIELEP
jgi:hypothetical protein